jgi:hypothetical protein
MLYLYKTLQKLWQNLTYRISKIAVKHYSRRALKRYTKSQIHPLISHHIKALKFGEITGRYLPRPPHITVPLSAIPRRRRRSTITAGTLNTGTTRTLSFHHFRRRMFEFLRQSQQPLALVHFRVLPLDPLISLPILLKICRISSSLRLFEPLRLIGDDTQRLDCFPRTHHPLLFVGITVNRKLHSLHFHRLHLGERRGRHLRYLRLLVVTRSATFGGLDRSEASIGTGGRTGRSRG